MSRSVVALALLALGCGAQPQTTPRSIVEQCQALAERAFQTSDNILWGGALQSPGLPALLAFRLNDGSRNGTLYTLVCHADILDGTPTIVGAELDGEPFGPNDQFIPSPYGGSWVRNSARWPIPEPRPVDDFNPENFAGPWADAHLMDVSILLSRTRTLGCGEFYTKVSATDAYDILVYCTRDGENWAAYRVHLENRTVEPIALAPTVALPY